MSNSQFIINAASSHIHNTAVRDCIAGDNIPFFDREGIDLGNNKNWVFPNPVVVYEKTGRPAETGVYTLGKQTSDYPLVLDFTYPISEVDQNDESYLDWIEIGSILVDGGEVYVAWKNLNPIDGDTFGIDRIDLSAKYENAFIETMVIGGNRTELATFQKIAISYSSLPENTDINIYYSTDYGTTWIPTTKRVDTDRKIITVEIGIEAVVFQLKLVFKVDANDSPVIESGSIILT